MATTNHTKAADTIWKQAIEICNLTHFWQPDYTLALMHSAIGPLIAAEALWQATFDQSYPNVVKSNLGREKIELYNAIPRPAFISRFIGDHEDDLGVAHFMAWVSFQQKWVRQLKAQTQAVIGEKTPQKILVIDDLHMEGGTRLLALSLLKHLYPKANVIFSTHKISGYWKDLGETWIETHFPQLSKIDDPKKRSSLTHMRYQFSSGTTDISKDDLGWRETTAADAILKPLLPYGPAELWLQYPKYIKKEIQKIIHHRVNSYQPSEPRHPAWPQRGMLSRSDAKLYILCDIWLRNAITAEEFTDDYALPEAFVHEILQHMLREKFYTTLVSYKENSTTYYTINTHNWMELLNKNISDFEQYLNFSRDALE